MADLSINNLMNNLDVGIGKSANEVQYMTTQDLTDPQKMLEAQQAIANLTTSLTAATGIISALKEAAQNSASKM